jgi:phospholipid/cholesterol/gamma-HCH transport system substrate-binding protein
METKANYTLVGGFVLFFVIAIFSFIIWVARIGFDSNSTRYDIYFTRSVTGLKEGSSVLYRGVPVGVVETITLDPNSIERVRVTVRLNGGITLRQDAFASLELQGITGTSYVQLNGGTQEGAILKPTSGSYRGVIPARSSVFEEVTDSLPAVMRQISRTFEEIREVFNIDNRESFAETMKNLKEITDALNPKGKDDKAKGAIVDLREGLKEFRSATTTLSSILKNNAQNINVFGDSGLPAFTRFLKEGSMTFSTYRRIGESLERSPGRFFHNDPKQGVKVP